VATQVTPIEHTSPTADRLLNEHEVAAFFKASVHTVRDWRKQGKGPRYRKVNGSMVRYGLSDCIHYWNSLPGGGAAK
jgi:predicted DNA-binding transcriptional regulator AlpA